MKYFRNSVFLICFSLTCIISCMDKKDTKTANFSTHVNKYTWPVKDFNLPKNWSDFKYIELELKLSSPERVSLMLTTGHGPSAITLLPAANAWICMDIPLKFYKQQNTEGFELSEDCFQK